MSSPQIPGQIAALVNDQGLCDPLWYEYLKSRGTGGGSITSVGAVASTSGTSIDFTSLPSTAKRLTLMFSGVSTSGTDNILVRLGSGSVTTTGYVSQGGVIYGTNLCASASSTAGFIIYASGATITRYGIMVLAHLGSNTWTSSLNMGDSAAPSVVSGSGSVTLGGAIDRLRVTTTGGTDTFDAGSINLFYE